MRKGWRAFLELVALTGGVGAFLLIGNVFDEDRTAALFLLSLVGALYVWNELRWWIDFINRVRDARPKAKPSGRRVR